MKIKTKAITYLLAISLIPLVTAAVISLNYVTAKVEGLTLLAAKERVEISSASLSGYFSSRLAEMLAYTQTPLVRSMEWNPIKTFLSNEVERHGDIYEKFILGLPSSHFRNTKVGNPAQSHLASFDDKDPEAKLKSIRKRGYWQTLVGTNITAEQRSHVSNPMISYTTGVKQVVVGASIIEGNRLLGMLGGAISWKEIKNKINAIRDSIIANYGNDTRLALVDSEGIFIYHWNPSKVVHLAMDLNGTPLIGANSEKIVKSSSIYEEHAPEFVDAGKKLLEGKSGYSTYEGTDHEKHVLLYAPVKSADYGLLMTIPRQQLLAPVRALKFKLASLIAITIVIVLIIAVIVSRKSSARIETLHRAALSISRGDYSEKIKLQGNDEIAQLGIYLNDMSEQLAERESVLKTATLAAETANRDKSGFLANMSHDLRTPLHAILGFASMGEKKVKENNNERSLYFFNRIHESASQLSQVMDNLLDLAKLEAGKTELNIKSFAVNMLIHDAVREVTQHASDKQVTIHQHGKDTKIMLESDAHLMHQVILHVLMNALKYSPDGTEVHIDTTQHPTQFKNAELEAVHIAISDQGEGILESELELIFDKVSQSDKSQIKPNGTSLGLPLCQEIINLLNGRIWAESPILSTDNLSQAGTCFHIVVPLEWRADD